jgi:hypothetical protein
VSGKEIGLQKVEVYQSKKIWRGGGAPHENSKKLKIVAKGDPILYNYNYGK